MKQKGVATKRALKLRQKTEEMLKMSTTSLKKMSAAQLRDLLEDLQIYQIELEQQNEKLIKMQQDLKDATEELRQSEMRYRALFHESREAKSLSKNGKIVEVNSKWLELHGFEDEREVLGADVLQFIHEADRGILLDRRKRWPEKLEAAYELRDVRRDGTIVDVEVYSSRIRIDGEVAILATLHDIGDRKRFREQTQRIKKMEALATLAAGVAQNFNNALSVISAHTGLLEMNFAKNEDVMESVVPMKQAVDRMANLTAQLLASGLGGRYHPRPVSMNDFVKTVISDIRGRVPDSVRLAFESAPGLPKVIADADQIMMVVRAVVENAFEAVGKEGYARITTAKERIHGNSGHDPGIYVCLKVQDNGKGMDSDTLDRVFDPFFTTRFVGRGLGLSAAYGIVKNHGGFISIESKPEEGTCVRVFLPAEQPSDDSNP